MHTYWLFLKLITRLITFQLTPTWYNFIAYRLISPYNRFLLPSQRIKIEKFRPNIVLLKGTLYTLVLAIPEVNNWSRDFSIDTNLVSF